jgi:hypothetical protein
MSFAIPTAFGSASINLSESEWPFRGAVLDPIPKRKAAASACATANAAWLEVVERRICDSVEPVDSGLANGSGAWITRDIADRSIAFLRCASDILPTEPHISSSSSGDLVADFELAIGNRLTVIVGARRLWAYAVGSGKSFKQVVETPDQDYGPARAVVEDMARRWLAPV